MYMNIRIRKENKIILAQTESLLHFISVLWKKYFQQNWQKNGINYIWNFNI